MRRAWRRKLQSSEPTVYSLYCGLVVTTLLIFKIQHKMNQCYHDVATQVNMDDVSGQKLGVGMATLGPSLGHRYVDPSPIARHVVNADAVEGKNPSNPV